jgi:hypothetical protein
MNFVAGRAEPVAAAAAAALSDKNLRQTNIAAAVGCRLWFGVPLLIATTNTRQ